MFGREKMTRPTSRNRLGVLSAATLFLLFFACSAWAGPDEDAIRQRFGEATTLWNAGNAADINAFMAYFSLDYLDEGEDYSEMRTMTLAEWADPGFAPESHTPGTITINGDLATMVVTWDDGSIESEHFRKEAGVWMIFGDQREYEVRVQTGRFTGVRRAPDEISVSLMVHDSDGAITSVDVSGPGLAGSVALNHQVVNPGDESPSWVSWSTGGGVPDVGPTFTVATRPVVGSTYTFVIQDTNRATVNLTAEISSYVDVFATGLSPAQDEVVITPTPMLSWADAGPGYSYYATVGLATGGNLWSADDLTTNSVLYAGPALVRNVQYTFGVSVRDGYWNYSFISVPFSYNTLGVTTTAGPLSYTEGDGAVAVDPGLTLTNVDGTQLTGATVTISSGYSDSEDSLGFTAAHGINGSFNTGSGVLSLSGTATTSSYQSVLRTVTYANPSQDPSEHSRTVSFQFSDTTRAASTTATRQINVTALNDAPTLTTVALLTGAQDDTDFDISHATLLAASNAADADTWPPSFRVESVDAGTLQAGVTPVTVGTSLLSSGGTWTWHPPPGTIGVVNAFQVKAWDGALLSAVPVQVQVEVTVPVVIDVSHGATPIANSIATPFDFGAATLFGAATELVFTITNNGTGSDLILGSVTLLNNRGFAVTQQPAAAVGAGANTTFRLQMQTATAGTMSAHVRFATNDPDDNPFVFAVTGTVAGTGDGDGNGMDDAWETFWFGQDGVDPHADADGDGWSNLQEYERGTNPTLYVIRLNAGWNLVSLARVPTANTVADIFGGLNIGPVWIWVEDHYEAATEMEPLRGHWVYVLAPVQITITLP